jgi:putative pyruvate formate lyase activating enzyme
MNQYTPMRYLAQMPQLNQTELSRKVTAEEYERVLDFADQIGIENGYMQEGDAAAESFIPAFDGEGL